MVLEISDAKLRLTSREIVGGGAEVLFAEPKTALQGLLIDDIPVIAPEKISEYDYEKIIVSSVMAFDDVMWELENILHVPREKIDTSYAEIIYHKTSGTRIRWLEKFAEMADFRGYAGNCAEVGVFNGSFAKHINRCFPDKKLYLFDTFAGFDVRDIAVEKNKNLAVGRNIGEFNSFTSIDEILRKMIRPDNIIFKVGFFPETAAGVDDTFTFVNLDVDLYVRLPVSNFCIRK